jgi:hypothetical protein
MIKFSDEKENYKNISIEKTLIFLNCIFDKNMKLDDSSKKFLEYLLEQDHDYYKNLEYLKKN